MNIRDDSFVEAEETFSVTLRTFLAGFNPFEGGDSEGELSEVLSMGVVTIQDDDCAYVSMVYVYTLRKVCIGCTPRERSQ